MNECNHESRIESAGFIVCAECGLCVDTILTEDNKWSENDHLIRNNKTPTLVGLPSERRGIYRRLSRPHLMGYSRNNQRDIMLLMKTLLANLGRGSELYRALYPRALKVYESIPRKHNLKGVDLFVPCITYVFLKGMGFMYNIGDIVKLSDRSRVKIKWGVRTLRERYLC